MFFEIWLSIHWYFHSNWFNILFLFQVIDKSFGFDTAVEEAQRAINAAHVEVESVENGVGIVKLMGRYSGELCTTQCINYHRFCFDFLFLLPYSYYSAAGFIAMFATLASRDVVRLPDYYVLLSSLLFHCLLFRLLWRVLGHFGCS